MHPEIHDWMRRLFCIGNSAPGVHDTAGGVADKPKESNPEIVDHPSLPVSKAIHVNRWSANRWSTEGQANWRDPKSLGRRETLVLVLGPAGAGKSTLCRKLWWDDMIGNRFETYDPTFEVPDEPVYRCGGYDYALYLRELKIRDINSISPILFPLAGIILVYDLSSPHSWDKAVRLKNIIRDSQSVQDGDKDKTRPSDIQVMMLGLKADIRGGHWVSRQEREEFAHQHGSLFAECSSCTGEGVHEAIGAFVEHMHGTVTRQPELVAEGSKRISNAALAEAAKQVISTLWTQSSALLGVYQQWRWLDLVKERKLPSKELDLRGGTMCIALWGSPGEDDCLRDMLLSDDIHGVNGKLVSKPAALLQNISAGFVCEGYKYTIDIILSEPAHLSDYYGVVLAYDVYSAASWRQVQNIFSRLR